MSNKIYYAVVNPTHAKMPEWQLWTGGYFDYCRAADVLRIPNWSASVHRMYLQNERMRVYYGIGRALMNSDWCTVFSKNFAEALYGNIVVVAETSGEPSNDCFVQVSDCGHRYWAVRVEE